MAQELCSLLREAQSDPSSSQLAALLQQYYTLKQSADNVSVPALSAIKERMETFEVLKLRPMITADCILHSAHKKRNLSGHTTL